MVCFTVWQTIQESDGGGAIRTPLIEESLSPTISTAASGQFKLLPGRHDDNLPGYLPF